MKDSSSSKPAGLRSDTLKSVVIHVVLWTLLLILFAPHAVPWAKTLMAYGMKKSAPQRAHQEKLPTKASLAAAMVEGQLSQMVSGELTKKDEQKLLEATHADIAAAASKLDESNTDISKMSEDLKKDALADMEAEMKNMAKDAMTQEVDSQLDGGVYAQVKNNIEMNSFGQMSAEMAAKIKEQLAQERQARADKAVAALEQAKKQLTDARDAADQAANQARASQFDPAATSAKQSSDTSTAADKAAADSVAQATKSFPEVAAAAQKTSSAFTSDTQDALQAASKAITAKNKDDASAQLGKADAALNNRITALSQLQDQVKMVGAAGTDNTSSALLAGSMADLKGELAGQMQKQSLDQMSGKIVDKMSQALQPQAAGLNMTPDQLKALIEAEVKARLAANLKDHPPDLNSSLNQSQFDNSLMTREGLQKAQAAADTALNDLTNARQAQAAVAVTDAGQSSEAISKQQDTATDQYDKAHQSLEAVRDLTRKSAINSGTQGMANLIGDNEATADAHAKMGAIPDLVQANQRDTADGLKTQLLQALDDRIAKVHQLRDSLGSEMNSYAADAKLPPLPAIDPALMDAMKAKLKSAVAEIATKHLPGILSDSGGGVVASDGQATGLRMDGIASLLGKVGQLQANMADGRPGLGLEGAGLGMEGGGAGGMGLPLLGRPGPGVGMSRFFMINAEAMEKFGKDLRHRSDPDNFYKPASDTDGIASVASPVNPSDLPATVYFDPQQTEPPAPATPAAPAAPREVPVPTFKTVAFGAAAMMNQPVNVDGDLTDWGELKHPMPTRFRADGVPVTDPTNVYVRWSPDGIYIGYTTKKQGPIVPDAHQGDCMEVWIDGENVRSKQMSGSQTSQQIFLAPFGYQGDARPAIVEVGRGNRGLKMFGKYVDRDGVLGKVAAKMVPGGYSVEVFLSRKAIAYPNLIPGAYLAFNFSVNRGVADTDEEQWSAPKSQMTWDKPDTWGDLLLLGSDATARFVSYDDPTKPAQPLVPGQPLAFEISDKDMDLNPHQKDRIPAVLRLKGAEDGLFVVLEETTENSGVFRGSVNTQAWGATPKADMLNIRGGESIELVYNDLRTEYGESDRIVTATLPVGTPVLRLAARP